MPLIFNGRAWVIGDANNHSIAQSNNSGMDVDDLHSAANYLVLNEISNYSGDQLEQLAYINTQAIRSALINSRTVIIGGDGVFPISDTAFIPSNTKVIVSSGVELKCVGANPFLVFANANYNSIPRSVTSLTVAAIGHNMLRATVTYASTPDVVAGNHILIKGDTSNFYNKIHEVETVNGNAVTFLIGQANGNTASATGTITATKADSNIEIYGPGKINGNFIGGTFTATGTYQDHAIMLNNVNRPVISELEFLDFRKYAVCMANAVYPIVDRLSGNSGSDCVHIYGPSWRPIIRDISGLWGDDGAIFQTIDGALYAPYQPPYSGGSFFEGGVIENVHTTANGNSGGVVFYPAGGDGTGDLGYGMFGTYVVDNVSHSGANVGTSQFSSAFVMGNGYVSDVGRIEQLHLKNIRGTIALTNAGANKVISVGTLSIDGHTTHGVGENQIIRIDYATIGQLSLTRFDVTNPSGTDNSYVNFQSANVNIGSVTFKDGRLNNLGSTFNLIKGGGATVSKITIDNVIGSGSGVYFTNVLGNEFATALDFNVVNCPNAPVNAITIGSTQAANIYANNISCSSSFYNLWGSGAIKIKSDYVVTGAPAFVNAQSNTTIVNPQRSTDIIRSNPSTGQTVTIQAGKTLGYCNTAHLIAPSGSLAALTLALPSDPINGEVIKITITQAIAALNVTGGTLLGTTSGASKTAGFSREFTYSALDSLWV